MLDKPRMVGGIYNTAYARRRQTLPMMKKAELANGEVIWSRWTSRVATRVGSVSTLASGKD